MSSSTSYDNAVLIDCVRAYLAQQPFNPSADTDWCALFEGAYRHKVAPVVWGVMAQQPEIVPPETWAVFTTWMDNLRRKNSYFALHLRRLSRLLSDEGIPTLAIKGLALAIGEYGSLSLRQFEDIDLLIAPEQMEQALWLLQAQGFVFTSARQQKQAASGLPPDDYHFQLTHPRWHISLELHWKVGWRQYNARDFPLSLAELTAEARELRLLDSPIRTFSPLHTVILLGVESFKDSRVTLGRLLEVALITRRSSFDWVALWTTAERVHALNETAALIGAAAAIFELPVPATAIPTRQRPVVRAVREKLLRDVQSEQIPTTLDYLHLLWQLRAEPREKLVFARQLISQREYWAYFVPRLGWGLLLASAKTLKLRRMPGSKWLASTFRPWKARLKARFSRDW